MDGFLDEVGSAAHELGVLPHTLWAWACTVNSACVRRALALKRITHGEVAGYCVLTGRAGFARLAALLRATTDPRLSARLRFTVAAFVLFSLDASEPAALPMSSNWLAQQIGIPRSECPVINRAVINLTLKLSDIR